MKKILSIVLALISIIFCGCNDPYKDYNATNIQPKTGQILNKDMNFYAPQYNNWNKVEIVKSFTDYNNYEFELGYTQSYFENNWLLIILQTSCSSDGFTFLEVKEQNNKLYPVIERNYIKDGEPVTDDIIYNLYYAEIPAQQYELGEIIYKYRK